MDIQNESPSEKVFEELTARSEIRRGNNIGSNLLRSFC